MIGLDTNVLVRFLVQDDPSQSRVASKLIEDAEKQAETLFLSGIVLCELIWVLDLSYRFDKKTLVTVLEKILSAPQFEIENREAVRAALEDYKGSQADFSDCLLGHVSRWHGCSTTYTFDKGTKGNSYFSILE